MADNRKAPQRFLCVDDDTDFQAYLLASAAPFNLSLDICGTLKEACEKLHSATYDGYVIDLNLPDGSGFALVQEIRETISKQVSVAVISGAYRDEDSFRVLKEKYGINYVLDKPIYPQQISNLFAELCRTPQEVSAKPDDKLQELRRSYEKTICNKIDLLSSLIKSAQNDPTTASLTELKNALHKIAGSAGSYGFNDVTIICKNMEGQLKSKIDSGAVVDKLWLDELDPFLNSVKYHFQVAPAHFESTQTISRDSLYVVHSDNQFLELLQREKELFNIDLTVESDPQQAIDMLKSPDFNPRAVVFSQHYWESSITPKEIIETIRNKKLPLPTFFGMILNDGDLDTRIAAMEYGIDCIFRSPVSAHTLLQFVANLLNQDTFKNFKVVVLDDDPDICQFIFSALTDLGIAVQTLQSSERLFEVLESFGPRLLFLDIGLPKHDGINVLKAVRADPIFHKLTIVIITVHDDPATRLRAFTADADEIIYKPLDRITLQKRVRSLATRSPLQESATQEAIGLDSNTGLAAKLRDALIKQKQRLQHLAVFEINRFTDLVQERGQTEMNSLLIQISNQLQHIASPTTHCFTINNLSRFAILFDEHDSHTLESVLFKLLFKIHSNLKPECDFNACIVPISRDWGGVREVVRAADEGLQKAAKKERAPVRIFMNIPEGVHVGRKEVFLIDSDDNFIRMIKNSFAFHDLEVKTFSTGTEALKALFERNEENLPALIISERKLPDMDGLDILKRLKGRFNVKIPFYFLTVFASDKDQSEGLSEGALEYISKPFNLSIFMQMALHTIYE